MITDVENHGQSKDEMGQQDEGKQQRTKDELDEGEQWTSQTPKNELDEGEQRTSHRTKDEQQTAHRPKDESEQQTAQRTKDEQDAAIIKRQQKEQREQESQRTKSLYENMKQHADSRKRYEDSGSDCSQRRSRSSTDHPQCYYAIKDRVVGRIFMGEYVERRRVKQINEYRDVVAVNPVEIPFINDLKYVLRCANKENAPEWLPITAPSSNLKTHRLWVSLPEGTPFEKYWFRVRSVKCLGNQIKIRLKILRIVARKDLDADATTSPEKRVPDLKIPSIDVKANVTYLATQVLNPSNILNAFRLVLLALTGLLAGLVEFMKHVGMWSIAFTREAGIMIERCTPLALGMLNFVSKVVGGMFIFLTMLYRDLRYGKAQRPPPPRPNYMAIEVNDMYYESRRRR